MRKGSPQIIHVLRQFELLFSERTWDRVKILVEDVPTFADTIAFVRQQLWPIEGFWMSCDQRDMVKIPRALLERLTDTLAFAA